MKQLNQAPSAAQPALAPRPYPFLKFFLLLAALAICAQPARAVITRTQIIGTTLPDANSLTPSVIERFSLSASSDVSVSSGANSANYSLRAAGANQVFGDADDVVHGLSAAVSGATISLTIQNGPLQPGRYRFETRLRLEDAAGAPIAPFSRDFAITQPVGGQIETANNDRLEQAATLPVTETPAGSRFYSVAGLGTFSSGTDVDYWRFDAQAGDRITVAIVSDPTTVQPSLQVRNAADAHLTSAGSSRGLLLLQDYTIPSPGSIYLRVSGNAPGGYTMRLDQSRGGPQLENEPNASVSAANVGVLKILAGGYAASFAGTIEAAGAADYFSLGHLTAGNGVAVNAVFPLGSTLGPNRLLLRLYRAGIEQPIAQSESGNLNFNLSADSIYYLGVEARDGAGIRAQYLANVNIADAVSPRILGVTLPAEGSSTTSIINDFIIEFSEDMHPEMLGNSANYELRNSGRDAQFNTGDDSLYVVANENYSGGLSPTFTLPDGPLQPGTYQLRVSTGINDRAGNPLNAAFVRRFSVSDNPEFPMEGRNNASAATATPVGTVSRAGDGSFTPVRSYDAAAGTYSIDAADFNRDGHTDLVTANYSGGNITIFLAQGGGFFAEGQDIPADGNPIFVRALDLNKDQQVEVITANSAGNSLSVFRRNADGSYAKEKLELSGAPTTFAVGDVNRDGIMDIVTAHGSVLAILNGTAAGTFAAAQTTDFQFRAPYGVILADVNGDTLLDVLVANSGAAKVSVLPGKVDGTFGPETAVTTSSGPRHLAAADLDGDNDRDLVVLCASENKVEVFTNDGTGRFGNVKVFEAQGSDAYDLRLADVTADGNLDVLVAGYAHSRLTILRNTGKGEFAPARHFSTPGNPISVVAGDFDKDGLIDVATANYGRRNITIFRGNPLKEVAADLSIPETRIFSARGSLAGIEDKDYWAFSLKAGEVITIAMETGVNASSLQAQFTAPDGQHLETFYSTGAGNGQMRPVTIPADGTYYLRFSYNHPFFGEYRWRGVVTGPAIQHESENNDSAAQANIPVYAPGAAGRTARILGVAAKDDAASGDYFALGTVASGTPINLSLRQPSTSAFAPTLEIRNGANVVASATDGKALAYVVPAGADAVLSARVLGQDGAKALGLGGIYLLDIELAGEATAPHVLSTDLPAEGTSSAGIINRFKLTFDEELDGRFNGIGREFEFREQSAYTLTPDASSWVLASSYAKSIGGHLTVIDDPVENEWLRQRFYQHGNLWIGLSDGEAEGTLRWESGAAVTYTQWGPGEPANTADRDFAGISHWGQWFLAGSANYLGLVETAAADSDGDKVPDAADPYPHDSFNGIDLRGAGGDGVFDTADDHIFRLASAGYTTGLSADFLIPDGPLPPGNYRLKVTRSLTDKAGNALEREFLRSFSVEQVAGYVVEGSSNDSAITSTSISSAVSDRADGSFTLSHQTPAGANPYSIVTADFNSDGNPDLATADYGSGTISVLTGRGDGTFGPAYQKSVGSHPVQIVTGDFNKDGRADLATASSSAGTVSLVHGDGKGGFEAALTIETGRSPVWLTVGDVDADGFDDVVTANNATDNATIIFGGAGAERKIVSLPAGNGPRAVALGDFNEDGNVDVVLASQNDSSLALFPGTGGGTFGAAVKTATVVSPQAMRTADLNHDGNLDLVVLNSNAGTLESFLGDGTGKFQKGKTVSYGAAGNYDFQIADLNGDGNLELIVPNYSQGRISVIWGRAGGTFAGAVQYQAAGSLISIQVADFNKDGLLDLATANYGASSVSLFTGNKTKLLAADSKLPGVLLGGGRGALLNREDQDYWSFTGTAGQRVLITAEAPGVTSGASLYYRLQRPTGEQVTGFHTSGAGIGQSAPVVLPVTGTYNLLVSYNHEFLGEYRFRVFLIDPPRLAETEGNNSIYAANQVVFNQSGGANRASIAGLLAARDDGDFYKLGTVSAGSPIEVTFHPGSENGVETKLELYRGTTLAHAAGDGVTTLNYTVPLEGDGDFTLKVAAVDPADPLGLSALYLADVSIRTEQVAPQILSTDLPEEGAVSQAVIDRFVLTATESLSTRINALARSYHQFGANYYTTTTASQNWEASEAEAQVLGGHLVTVNDAAENDWLLQTFTAPFWIGLNDAQEEGNFVWSSGEPLSYSNWNSGEPNNSGDEDYAHVYSFGPWNDLPAGSVNFGVIEINGSAGTDTDSDGLANEIDPYPTDPLNAIDIREAGADGVFGTADDQRYPVRPEEYGGGTNLALRILNSPLPQGKYRLTVTQSITDQAGNPIAAPFVRTFTVQAVAPFVLENGGNNSFDGATSLALKGGLPNGSFTAGQVLPVGRRVSAMAGGDFNRDGKPDLAVAAYDAQRVVIFLADAFGELKLGSELETENTPYYLLAGDFNRDQVVDLAVANYGSHSVSIFIGVGDGTFRLAKHYPSGNSPWMLAAGDLNGDGFPEVISANYAGGNVTVISGARDWENAAVASFSAGNAARGLAVGDVNGDGLADVLVTSAQEHKIALLAGIGNLALQAPIKSEAGYEPRFIELEDVTGDGLLDWLVLNNAGATLDLYVGDGKGGYSSRSSTPISSNDAYQMLLRDLNGDFRKDVIVVGYNPSSITVVLNEGAGIFATPVTYSLSGNPLSAVVADFNGDGLLDIIAGNYGGSSLSFLHGSISQALARNETLGVEIGSARGNVSDRDDVDYYTFSGRAGQRVLLLAQAAEGANQSGLAYRIYQPGGREIGNAFAGPNGHASAGPIELPVNGNYFIGVAPSYNYFGEYRLRVLLAGEDAVVESEPNNSLPGNFISWSDDGAILSGEIIGTAQGAGDLDYFSLGVLEPGSKISLTIDSLEKNVPVTVSLHGADGRELANPVIASGAFSFVVPESIKEAIYARVRAFHFAPGLYRSDADRFSLYFDGDKEYVSIPDSPALRPANLTIEGWFNFEQVHRNQMLLSKPVGTAFLNSYALWYDGSALNGIIGDSAGSVPALRHRWEPAAGRWYHLAYVFNDLANTHALFIDGVEVARAAANRSIGYDSNPLLIGAESDNENIGYFFTGNIDEVRVWELARTAGEIRATRNLRLTGQEAGLRAYWRFDEGSGSTVADATSHNPPAQLVKSPDWVPAAPEFAPGNVLAQYQLRIQLEDSAGPVVAGTSLVEESAEETRLVSRIQVAFSESIKPDFNEINRTLFSRNGHGYLITPEGLSWLEAQALARNLGGYLTVINDGLENQWVRQTFSFAANLWIGLSDRAQEGLFVWDGGQLSQYSAWSPGEPVDHGDEDFVLMNQNGVWMDARLFANHRAIIEFEGTDSDRDGFPDVIDPLSSSAANYFDLREAGRDGIFETLDDDLFTLAPGDYAGGLALDLTVLDGPLLPGKYRFTVSALQDLSGNPLKERYVRHFNVVPRPGFTTESRNNNEIGKAVALSGASGGELFGGFVSGNTFEAGRNPYNMASGDINGDGLADLVVPNYGAEEIEVLLGTAAGGFVAHRGYPVANGPIAVVLRDFNKDQRLDIGVVSYNSSRLSLFLGAGDGSFTAAAVHETGSVPVRITSGDYDGDTNIDLAVANYNGRSVSVFFGTGQGVFTGPTNITVAAYTRGIASADLDRDGRDDLIYVTESPGLAIVARGQSNRALTGGTAIELPGNGRAIAVGQFDGAGVLEAVIVTSNGRALLLASDGAAGLTVAAEVSSGVSDVYDVVPLELNGDGLLDFAIAAYGNDRVSILEQLPNHVLSAPLVYTVQGGPVSLIPSDVDKNGQTDLIVSLYRNNSLAFLYGAGATALAVDSANPGLRLGSGRGTLTTQSDTDYWSFYARAGDSIQVGIASASTGGSLYGNLLAPNGDSINSFSVGPGRAIDSGPRKAPVTGNYYVVISSNTEWVGEYVLRAMVVEPPGTIEAEANNSVTAASDLQFVPEGNGSRATASGYVNSANDLDYFQLGEVAQGSTLYLTVRLASGENPLVPIVAVYDAANGYVPEEGGQAFDSVAEIRVQKTGNYFVMVRGAGTTSGLTAQYVMEARKVPTGTISFPNLQVANITLPAVTQILSGSETTIRYTVRNAGGSSTLAANWTDRVSLSANEFAGDNDDIILTTIPHAGILESLQSYEGSAAVSIPDGLSGSYYIVVETDSTGQVGEFLFEGDNLRRSESPIDVIVRAYPDLVVEGLAALVSESGPILITWNLANRGSGDAGGTFSERVVVRNLGTGAIIYSQEHPVATAITAGAAIPRTVSLTRPGAGRYEVIVTTDAGENIFELNPSGHLNAERNAFSTSFDLLLVNRAPVISPVLDQVMAEDGILSLPLNVDDGETGAASVFVSASAANPLLVPSSRLTVAGTGASRTLTIRPAANQNGTTVVTVTATDGLLSASSSFALRVTAVNDAPTISRIPNTETDEDTTSGLLPFIVSDVESEPGALTVKAETSSNPALIPLANIGFGGSGSGRAVVVTPAADRFGQSLITLRLSDGEQSATASFLVTVRPVNDPPEISRIAGFGLRPGGTSAPVEFTISDVESGADSLVLSVNSSTPEIIPHESIVLGGSGATRTAVISSLPGASGKSLVTISVSDAGGAISSSSFEVTVSDVALLIVSHPESKIASEGSRAEFAVKADGAGPLTYQWFVNGVAREGERNSTLVLSSAQLSDAGTYRVAVTDAAGTTALSREAKLRVIKGIAIEAQPAARTVLAGANTSFSVKATGAEPLSYQWYFNDNVIPGATSPTLLLNAVKPAFAGEYSVRVSNPFDEEQSSRALLRVEEPVRFVTQPEDQLVKEGGSFTLSAEAKGAATYQWYFRGLPIADQSSTLTRSAADRSHSGEYRLEARGANGTAFSRVARVLVVAPPQITRQPIAQSVALGGSTKLGLIVSGTEPLQFEWFRDGLPVAKTDLPVLELLNAGLAEQGDYTVKISNLAGEVVSSPVRVTVVEGVQLVSQPQAQVRTVGETVTFSVDARGTGARYQWYYRGVPIPNATTSTFTIQNARITDSGSYAVEVSNASGAVRSVDASLRVVSPPAITRQPASQQALLNGAARFVVGVSGSEPLSIQWTLNGVEIPGATGPILVLSNLQEQQEGDIRAQVQNPAGTILSEAATLQVLRGVQILSQPIGRTIRAGAETILEVTAGGSGPFAYQWQRNGLNIPGANASTHTAREPGNYTVRVSNPAGSAMSAAAEVRVLQPVTFRQQPVALTLKGGGSAVFKVVADGSGPLTYQWQFNGQDIPGATSDILFLRNIDPAAAGNYQVLVSNELGSELSEAARLGIIDPPVILSGPVSQLLNVGAGLSLSVTASGAQPLSYQWTLNGVAIPGATGPTFSVSSLQPTNAGNYAVTVSNPGGVVNSSIASIALQLPSLALADARANAPARSDILGVFRGSNSAATREANEPDHAPNQPAQASVWLSWTAPLSGVVTFTTAGSSFDTILAAYIINGQGQLQQQASNEDGAPFKTSIIQLNAVQGTTYWIAIDGYKGATGNIIISWTAQQMQPRLPRITRQPVGFTALAGRSAQFSVEAQAADTGALSYQWFYFNTPLSGQTSSTLNLPVVEPSMVGRYSVRVSNESDPTFFIISDFAPLQVNLIETQMEGPDVTTADKPNIGNRALLPQSIGNRPIRVLQAPARGFTGSQVFSTVGLVRDESEPAHCNASGGASAWSLYEAPANGSLLVTTDGSFFDTVVAVYSGSGDDFASMVLLGCDDNGGTDAQDSRIVVPVTQGGLYFIVVDGVNGASGVAQLNYTLSQPPVITQQPQVAGIQLLSQGPITEGANVTLQVVATNLSASAQTYQWKFNGQTVAGQTTNTYVINGITRTNEGTYSVTIENFAGQTQSESLNLSILSDASIVTPLSPQSVVAGGSAVFTVAANGTAPLTYEWRRDGVVLTGENQATLTLPNVQAANAGTYEVRVSNLGGTATSQAVLTVLQPVTISEQPSNLSVNANGTATFRVSAAGSGTLGYQWRFNGVNLEGEIGTELVLPAVQPQLAGTYSVFISNAVSSVVSDDAILSVVTPVTIVQQPRDQTISGATTTQFEVITSGSEPITYQWRFDGVPIAGATSRVLSLTNLTPQSAGRYSVVASNAGATVTSTDAVLTLTAPPTISRQPSDLSAPLGGTAVFTVEAAGSGTLSYQWRFNGVHIPGATGSTLTLANLTLAESGEYSVAIDNSVGSVVSAPAELTVNTPVTIIQNPVNVTALAGSTVEFTVAASGSGPLFYQWLFNESEIVAATNEILVLTNIQSTAAGAYRARVSNPGSTNTSAAAVLIVQVLPAIAAQPQSQTVNSAFPATFTVTATGSPPLAYQWRFNGVPMTGETNATLRIAAAGLAHEGDYTVLVSNDAGAAGSEIAVLSIHRGDQVALLASIFAGEITIRLSGPAGRQCDIESSPDFQTWAPAGTVTLNNGQAEFRQALGAAGFRFYRALLKP